MEHLTDALGRLGVKTCAACGKTGAKSSFIFYKTFVDLDTRDKVKFIRIESKCLIK